MRKLSGFEGSYISRTNHDIYYNFIVGAEYKVPLTKDIILDTVARLCWKYPQLSLRVDGYNSIYSQSYTVDDVFIDVVETGDVAEICQKYTLHKFNFDDIDKPLFKLIYVIDTNTIFFIADHIYFDGTSGKNFHILFAKELENRNTALATRFINTSGFNEFPDPTKLLNFQKRYKSDTNTTESWMPKLDTDLMELPMPVHRSTMITISSEQTKKLLQFARSNDVKLTSLLQSISVKCITRLYKSDGVFKTLIAVNSRPYIECKDVYKEFGILFGKYVNESTVEDIKSTGVVELSQVFQKALNDNKESATKDAEIFETLAMEDYSIVEKVMDRLVAINDKPSIGLVISNLGNIDSPMISSVYFDQPMVDTSFSLHVVSCTDGGMTLNCTSHRAINKYIYQEYVDSFINTLYTFI